MSGRNIGSNSDKSDISSKHSSSSASTPAKRSSTPTPSTSKGVSGAGHHSNMGTEQKFSSSSREMRNLAEKMRRDKLNNYVTELAGIVPLGSGANKRVDKISILRLAANFIRMHKFLKDEEGDGERLSSIMQGDLSSTLAEAVGGFLLVLTSSGKVVYVTEAVEQFFGHSQVDLLGHSIYNVIHPDDHEIVQQQLQAKENTRRSFFCRMMEKALSRNDPGRYEIIHIVGQMKPIPQAEIPIPSPTISIASPDSGSSKHGDDDDEEELDGDVQSLKVANRIGTHMLVSFVRVVKDRPITELSLVESTQEEYITRHGTDGRILYTDHRISFVTGLMPSEVLGTSAFTYMHQDDMVWSVVAQKLMLTSSLGQGVVSYRLRCKDGTYVTLRTRGFLEFNKQKEQVDSFVCINTVLSVKDAAVEIRNQRRKLLPMITCQESDEHLNTITASFPPDMLMLLKQMMSPDVIQKMINSVETNIEKDCSGHEIVAPEEMPAYSPANPRREADISWKDPSSKRAKVHPQDNQLKSVESCFEEPIQNVQYNKDDYTFQEISINSITSSDNSFTQESTKKFSFQRNLAHGISNKDDLSVREIPESNREIGMAKTVGGNFVPVTSANQVVPDDFCLQKDVINFSNTVLSPYVQQPSPNLLSPECYPPNDSINQQARSPNVPSPMHCDQLGSNLQTSRYVDKKGITSPGQIDHGRSGSMTSPGNCDMLIPSQSSGKNVSPNPYNQRIPNLATNFYDYQGASSSCSSQYNPCVRNLASPSQYDHRGGSLSSAFQHEGNMMSLGAYDQRGGKMASDGQYDQRSGCLTDGTLCPPAQGLLQNRSQQHKRSVPITSGEFESQMMQAGTSTSLQQQPQHFHLDKEFTRSIQSIDSSNVGCTSHMSAASEFNMQIHESSHLKPQTGTLQHHSKSNYQTVPLRLNHLGEANIGSCKGAQLENDMTMQYSTRFQQGTALNFDTPVPVTLSEIHQSKRKYQHSANQ